MLDVNEPWCTESESAAEPEAVGQEGAAVVERELVDGS